VPAAGTRHRRQVWLATGTDLGGSLRNPASFCGVVGMRNSVGLVPRACSDPSPQQLQDRALPYWRLQSVNGMLARSAQDLALALDAAVTGCHADDPTSRPAPAVSFTEAVRARLAGSTGATHAHANTSTSTSSSSSQPCRPRHVAFSADLGVPPVDAGVEQLCRAAAGWWQQQGAQLTEAAPELGDMQGVFMVSAHTWCGVRVVGAALSRRVRRTQPAHTPYSWHVCAAGCRRCERTRPGALQPRC
jgi:amidase